MSDLKTMSPADFKNLMARCGSVVELEQLLLTRWQEVAGTYHELEGLREAWLRAHDGWTNPGAGAAGGRGAEPRAALV